MLTNKRNFFNHIFAVWRTEGKEVAKHAIKVGDLTFRKYTTAKQFIHQRNQLWQQRIFYDGALMYGLGGVMRMHGLN